jgi:F0F1-type ATP synthase membrane subunit b/b'
MATHEPGAREDASSLTALPRVEELGRSDGGFDEAQVTQAFESFRRHITQLQTQLRVLQAAGQSAGAEPTGHAVRMDALHLVRAAAEFADTLEKDAQDAAARVIRKAETEISDKQREFQKEKQQIERHGREAEQKRSELLAEAEKEARETRDKADREATQQLKDAEARGTRLLEQSRHQATELTNNARAEIDQSLEWARSQGADIVRRAREGAEQLLGAAGLGGAALDQVVKVIAGDSGTESGSASRKSESSGSSRSSGTVTSAKPPEKPSSDESTS